jgi:imidazolonepropionase
VLGVDDRGSIEVGKRADLLVLDAPVEHVPYRFGHNPVRAVIAGGELVT